MSEDRNEQQEGGDSASRGNDAGDGSDEGINLPSPGEASGGGSSTESDAPPVPPPTPGGLQSSDDSEAAADESAAGGPPEESGPDTNVGPPAPPVESADAPEEDTIPVEEDVETEIESIEDATEDAAGRPEETEPAAEPEPKVDEDAADRPQDAPATQANGTTETDSDSRPGFEEDQASEVSVVETNQPPPSASSLLDQDEEFGEQQEQPAETDPAGLDSVDDEATPVAVAGQEAGDSTEPAPTDVLPKSELRGALDSDQADELADTATDEPEVRGDPEGELDAARSPNRMGDPETAPIDDSDPETTDDESREKTQPSGEPDGDSNPQPRPEVGPRRTDPSPGAAEQTDVQGSEGAGSDPERPGAGTAKSGTTETADDESTAGSDGESVAEELTDEETDASTEAATGEFFETEPGELSAQPPTNYDDSSAGEAFVESYGWRPSRTSLVVAGVLAVVLTALGSTAAVVTWLDGDRLRRTLSKAEQRRAPDTYDSWRQAFDTATAGANRVSTPGTYRSGLHTIGGLLGFESPDQLRRRMRRRRAYYASMLEYRFERPGSRSASALADQVFADSSASPLGAATHTYVLLAKHRTAAAAKHLEESTDLRETAELANAKLEASLADGDGERARELANALTAGDSNYRRYLLARADRFVDGAAAAESLRTFTDKHSSDHLDARIARVRALRVGGDLDGALEYGSRVRDKHLGGASNYQRARLLVELGRIHRANDDVDRAREKFRAAVSAAPQRSSVYLPLVDLLIERGRLDEARGRLDRATSIGGEIPAMAVDRARLAYLEGAFKRVLKLVDSTTSRPRERSLLRARALLRLGRYKAAAEELGGGDPTSQALALLAELRSGQLPAAKAAEKVDSLISDDATPVARRAAARIHLSAAHRAFDSEGDTAGRDYAQRAVDLLTATGSSPADRALDDYLTCRALLFLKKSSEASSRCNSARRANSKFLPGMFTVAQLHLRRGDTEKATLLLDGLAREDRSRWEMVEIRVRAALRNRRPGRAASRLEQWNGAGSRPGERRFLEGLVAFHRGDYTGALEKFGNAAEKGYRTPELQLHRAHARIRADRNREGAADRLQKLNDHPRWSPSAWLVFAELRRRQGRTSDALENLEIAREKFADDFAPAARLEHLYVEYARTWSRIADWRHRKVREFIDSAREVTDAPPSPELHLALGEFTLRQKQPDVDAAIDHARSTLKIQPARCAAARLLARGLRAKYPDDPKKAEEKISSIKAFSSGRCSR